MRESADKYTSKRIIIGMLKRRLKDKGHDVSSFSEQWFDEKAEEIYNEDPGAIKVLDGQTGSKPEGK